MANLDNFLASALAEVLEIKTAQVSVTMSFSEQGVDSLLALQFIRKIRDKSGLDLQLETLFDYPTLDELASYLHQTRLHLSDFSG